MESFIDRREGSRAFEFAKNDDLERQLARAGQRYATARGAGEQARAELRELAGRKDVSAQLLKSGRIRLEAINARCRRLRDLIEKLEERLDL